MNTTKKIITLILGVASLYGCSTDKKAEIKDQPIEVKVFTTSQSSSKGIYLSGEVTAKQTATISTRMMGFVNKIYVKPGDKVSKGQLLVSISSDDILAKKAQVQAMITEAEAASKNAQRDYERFKTLHQKKSVSDKELENIALQNTSMNAKVQMAHQQMNEVNAMLAYTNIRAPFSGVITQKMIEEGSMANPGMPLLSLEQSGEMQIETSVPESHIQYLKVGDTTQIELKSLGIQMSGRIEELSPSAYRTGGQYMMKISFDSKANANVHSGMYANIYIPNIKLQETNNKMLVNVSSIIYKEQLTGIYIVNEANEAILHWVRLGKKTGEEVEILSGISSNEKVIAHANGKLYNGKKVTIIK